MIRHVVLLNVPPTVDAAEYAAVFAELAGMEKVIPGFRGFAGGANVSAEGLAKGFTHAFTIDFDDAAARDAYLAHPTHQAAAEALVGLVAGGLAGILALDFSFGA